MFGITQIISNFNQVVFFFFFSFWHHSESKIRIACVCSLLCI